METPADAATIASKGNLPGRIFVVLRSTFEAIRGVLHGIRAGIALGPRWRARGERFLARHRPLTNGSEVLVSRISRRCFGGVRGTEAILRRGNRTHIRCLLIPARVGRSSRRKFAERSFFHVDRRTPDRRGIHLGCLEELHFKQRILLSITASGRRGCRRGRRKSQWRARKSLDGVNFARQLVGFGRGRRSRSAYGRTASQHDQQGQGNTSQDGDGLAWIICSPLHPSAQTACRRALQEFAHRCSGVDGRRRRLARTCDDLTCGIHGISGNTDHRRRLLETRSHQRGRCRGWGRWLATIGARRDLAFQDEGICTRHRCCHHRVRKVRDGKPGPFPDRSWGNGNA